MARVHNKLISLIINKFVTCITSFYFYSISTSFFFRKNQTACINILIKHWSLKFVKFNSSLEGKKQQLKMQREIKEKC